MALDRARRVGEVYPFGRCVLRKHPHPSPPRKREREWHRLRRYKFGLMPLCVSHLMVQLDLPSSFGGSQNGEANFKRCEPPFSGMKWRPP